jgi:hypothetical protein
MPDTQYPEHAQTNLYLAIRANFDGCGSCEVS